MKPINIQTILDDLVVEKRTRDVIVCDIQPMYQDYFTFNLHDVSKFLLDNRKILFFFNGPYTVGEDSEQDISEMFYNEFDEDIYEKLTSNQTRWVDKGYGFFRSWMDFGASDHFIQQAIRFMVLNRINDSRDIDPDVWREHFPDDFSDVMIDDPLVMPDISLAELKTWNGAYLIGGGRNECLKEAQLLMNAFNIKYTLVNNFIYG